MNIQSQIANLSFLFLLGSLIFYWIGLSKPELWNKNQSNVQIGDSVALKSEVSGQLYLTEKKNNSFSFSLNNPFTKGFSLNIERTLGRYGIIFANILLFILLCLRWKESGHFPLSNLYESLMFLSWAFTTLHLWLEKSDLIIQLPSFNDNNNMNRNTSVNYTPLIGAITTPSALFTNAFATFTLPQEMQEAAPLVPALQSNWLMMHVTVMIISYAALILGSLLSVAYLIITSLPSYSLSVASIYEPTVRMVNNNAILESSSASGLLNQNFNEVSNTDESIIHQSKDHSKLISFNNRNKMDLYSLAKTLDNLSYRILGIGFPFLTIGILSGAVWANEAWGSYWSWDPKETWALLTWLIFAIYLHSRLNKTDSNSLIQSNSNSKLSNNSSINQANTDISTMSQLQLIINEDRKPAIIATLGLIVVWICYLGVNLIGEGLHSYGWFK